MHISDLSNFSDALADRTIEVIANNTAVIPCATPIGQPSTITEFEVNSTTLVLTGRITCSNQILTRILIPWELLYFRLIFFIRISYTGVNK